MNCKELFEVLKQEAPTEERCLTKPELRKRAEWRHSGISGSRINVCLERLEGVKESKKCNQWIECYYDPPTSDDRWLIALCIAGVAVNVLVHLLIPRLLKPPMPAVEVASLGNRGLGSYVGKFAV